MEVSGDDFAARAYMPEPAMYSMVADTMVRAIVTNAIGEHMQSDPAYSSLVKMALDCENTAELLERMMLGHRCFGGLKFKFYTPVGEIVASDGKLEFGVLLPRLGGLNWIHGAYDQGTMPHFEVMGNQMVQMCATHKMQAFA